MDIREYFFNSNDNREIDDVEKLTENAIRKIKDLPITETDKQLRLNFLDYAISRLRRSRYEEDEEEEKKWLELVNRLTKKDFSHVEFNVETELFLEKEKDNLTAVITMFKDKVNSSFKLDPESKSNYINILDQIYERGYFLLKKGDIKSYNKFISESIDKIWDELGPYFTE